MSIALIFITHEGIASNLLTVGESIIQKPNQNIAFSEVPMDESVESVITDTEDKLLQLDIDEGIIFITDIFGSTPSNIAHELARKYSAPLLSGVNLPMVIRLLGYRDLSVNGLLEKAQDGAIQGIRHEDASRPDHEKEQKRR
jgi:mannose/fructose-specific phosphotransferase system component IIA